MNPSEIFFIILSGIISILGVVLILHALWLFRQEKKSPGSAGSPISLKIFNMELNGTNPLAILSIGAALIAFPLYYSVNTITGTTNSASISNPANQNSESQTPLPRYPLTIVPEPKPGEFKNVETAPEPNYKGLHFFKDVRVIDLRSRVRVPPEKKLEKYSPITWVRYTLLEKLSHEDDEIRFEFATSGVGVDPRCLTHDHTKLHVTGRHTHGDLDLKDTWQILVNVKNEKPKTPFLIINEATYWNAFDSEVKEWASMRAEKHTDTDHIVMIILFPENKPMKNYSLYAYPHDSERRLPLKDASIDFKSESDRVFVWKVENPKQGYSYEVDWTW